MKMLLMLAVMLAPLRGADAQEDKATSEQSPAAKEIVEAKRIIERQFEAAGTDIKAAVVGGEMSEAEGWAAWHAARREIVDSAVESGLISEADGAGYQQWINSEQLGGQLKEAGARIKAAAQRGEMSEAEAWNKWYTTKEALITEAVEGGQITDGDAAVFRREIRKAELHDRLGTAGGRIEEAAARGELSDDEAWAEWYATKEQLISEAVELGEITKEDAAEFQRGLHQAELKERIGAAGERIKAAVVSGEMTEDEGWDAWAAAREELIAEATEAGEISAEDADEFRRGYERWAIGRRLKTAVARGEMTEEEAWAAWAEYNNETDEIAEKLQAMVERGELTAEEAEAKLRAIENALGERAKSVTLDIRTVLRAIKRVDLTSDQRERIRAIEREAGAAYRKIPRKDKQAHTELATRVKAEIVKLLKPDQVEQFEAALKRLDRGSRRAKQPERRPVTAESETGGKKTP